MAAMVAVLTMYRTLQGSTLATYQAIVSVRAPRCERLGASASVRAPRCERLASVFFEVALYDTRRAEVPGIWRRRYRHTLIWWSGPYQAEARVLDSASEGSGRASGTRLGLQPSLAHRIRIRSEELGRFWIGGEGRRHEKSDLDILVTFDGKPTFDRFMGLKLYLEDTFGRSVDLGTPETLRPEMRAEVERELIHVP